MSEMWKRVGVRAWIGSAVAGLAFVSAGTASHAETVSYPMSFDSVQGDLVYSSFTQQDGSLYEYFARGFYSRAVWDRFDLSLGTLHSVTIEGKLNYFLEYFASDPEIPATADSRIGLRFLNDNGILYGGSGAVFGPDGGNGPVATGNGYFSVLGQISVRIVLAHPGFPDLANNPFAIPNNLRFPFIGSGTNADYPGLVPYPYVSFDLSGISNIASANATLIGTTDAETPSSISVTYDYTPAAVPEPGALAGGGAMLTVLGLRRRR